uniref:hypothetical protein n=1 Tax=Porphyridium aerugineum TaxID=2792 RepID=UPI001FCD8456|nr:hypothetical protein MW505_pgp172 [Porphyridium aerugineum]UNJ17825.1 hypothetical protein [Porphyridium aerugineum]
MPKYYFAVASQKFFLEEEPIEEVLREKTYYYSTIQKPIDFWLVLNPKFLDKPEISKLKDKIKQPAAAIISTNPTFINWIKLRIGYVLTGQVEETDLKNLLAEAA